jgi:hypothetical protein
MTWFPTFLAFCHHKYALANISSAPQEDYLRVYPDVVPKTKRKSCYAMRYMQLSPSRSSIEGRHSEPRERGAMTDVESSAVSGVHGNGF